ncbi:MAG TPA: OmpA family protein, partial [Sphingobacteriaceae bacterium]
PAPAPVEEKEEAPEPVKMPEFNYSNVQFEFNSAVLKTASYATLDQMGQEMKKFPEVKFNLNGHASIEGSASHNMTLSVDRANSVKAYLVNMGVPTDNLVTTGFGATQPVASNDDESGRALNRRVEIKKM